VVADIDLDGATRVAAGLATPAVAMRCDVSDPDQVASLISNVQDTIGPIDLFCSNAGIGSGHGLDADPATWERVFRINSLSIVWAARALLAQARGGHPCRLLVTASAAGLLTNLGDAPYTATKHAAVGLAEWISITHGDDGLSVSCLCPQGVRTPLVTGGLDDGQLAAGVVELMGLIEPEDCAEAVMVGLADDRFLILPHPEVADYQLRKVTEPDRWLGGMRKLQRQLTGR
jgi:NAD(P)-dependent dehydrogenase (short-subunit alcohol dehydrogenase family)